MLAAAFQSGGGKAANSRVLVAGMLCLVFQASGRMLLIERPAAGSEASPGLPVAIPTCSKQALLAIDGVKAALALSCLAVAGALEQRGGERTCSALGIDSWLSQATAWCKCM